MLIQTYWFQQFGQLTKMEKLKPQTLQPQADQPFDPQAEFIDACLSKGVPFSYGQLFLQSLELRGFSSSQEEIKFKAYAIAEQIGLISRGESASQQLQEVITERQGIVRQLRNELTSSVQSRQLNLTSVCLKIESIRIYSLMLIQKIQLIIQKLKIVKSPYFTQILQKINQDIDFLRHGPLRKYIEFSREKDPLLMVPLRKFNLTEGNPRKPLVNLFQVEPELLKRLEKAELTLKKITSEPDCLVELGRNEDSLTEIVSEGYRSKYSSIEEEQKQRKLKQLLKKLKGPERQELEQILEGKKKKDNSKDIKSSKTAAKQTKQAVNTLQPSPIRYKDKERKEQVINPTRLPSLLSNNMRIHLKSLNKSIQTTSRYQRLDRGRNSIDANSRNSQTKRKLSVESSSHRKIEGQINQSIQRKNEIFKRKQTFRRSVSKSPSQQRERKDRQLLREYMNQQSQIKKLRNINYRDEESRQYRNVSTLSNNKRPYLQKLHQRDERSNYEERSSTQRDIAKNNFRSINPIIERQDGILSIMPAHPNFKIPIRIVRQKQINLIEPSHLRNIMEEDVSQIKIYMKSFNEEESDGQQSHKESLDRPQEKEESEVNPILRRVPTLILFHDSDNDSSSGESNDLNQMEHPEMQLVESESISLIARDSMQQESSFDFNRIQSPISDIYSRKGSPILNFDMFSYSENHKTLNPIAQVDLKDSKQSVKASKEHKSQNVGKQVGIQAEIKNKQSIIQPQPGQKSEESPINNSNINIVEESEKGSKKDQSSSNILKGSALSEEQKISLLKNCVFKSKSLLIKDLFKIITKINPQKAKPLLSMLSSGYMANRHINIISCLSNNQVVSYCLAHPQITPKIRILYVLHLEVIHKKFKAVEVQMVNEFIKFLFGSDPCHYIAILLLKDFQIEGIKFYKNLSFFVKIIDTPAYLTQFNSKALLLERKGLKCQHKEDYVNVLTCILLAVLPVKGNVVSISNLPSNLDAKLSARLTNQLNQQLKSSVSTNFVSWPLVQKYLKEEALPALQQIQYEGPFKMAIFSLEDCMLRTKFSVYSKQFYFCIEPPATIIFQTKIAYFMILATANSKRYCVFGDKLYEEDEHVDVLKQFQEFLEGQKLEDILNKSKKESSGKIITCPQFKKTIKSCSQQASVTLDTELVWKQYIKGVRKPNEEEVYLQLVTPFFWGVAQLNQENRLQLLVSTNIQEAEIIK